MLQRWSGKQVVPLAMVMVAFTSTQALFSQNIDCVKDCYLWNADCFTTAASKCDEANNRCYLYDNGGISCYTCGKANNGDGYDGFCIYGDPSLVCKATDKKIPYKVYKKCICNCKNAPSTYASAAVDQTMPTGMKGDFTQYLCQVKPSP